MKDPYTVLGVPRDADADTIRKAFRKLARKHHPDKSKAEDAEERFKEISAAHELLSDPEKRALYDRFGEAGLRAGGDPRRPGAGQGMPPGGMEDILEALFGGGVRTGRRRTSRGANQRARLAIDLMTAIMGGERRLRVGRPGGRHESLTVKIPAGVGDGDTLRLRGQGHPPPGGGTCGDLHVQLRVRSHPLLRRRGDDLELDVPITVLESMEGGSATVPTPTGAVKLTIPRGARSGQRMRLRGRGVQRPGRPGDLYVILRVAAPEPTEDPGVLAAARALEQAYVQPVRQDLQL